MHLHTMLLFSERNLNLEIPAVARKFQPMSKGFDQRHKDRRTETEKQTRHKERQKERERGLH